MVTGHRQLVPVGHVGNPWPENPVVAAHHDRLERRMLQYLRIAYDLGYRDYVTGMAIGADQLFAAAVMKLKTERERVKLIAACPFKGQESKWPPAAKKRYADILAAADEVHYVSDPGYAAWKMRKRNEWMVDRTRIVLAVWDGRPGGTTDCVNYALKTGRYVVRLDPQELRFEEVR